MSIFNPSDTDTNSIGDIATVGAVTASPALYGLYESRYKGSKTQGTINKYGSKIPGSMYLEDQLKRTTVSTTGNQLVSSATQSLQKSLLSVLMALEEMSPLHILRTLQLSNIIQPFAEIAKNTDTVHITASQVKNQQHYYEALIKYVNEDNNSKLKRQLEFKDLLKGFYFENNSLYGVGKDNKINRQDIVLKNARLTLGATKNGEIQSFNHVVEKYSDIIGGKINKQALKQNPLLVVGGKDNLSFGKDWIRSMTRFSMEVGFKTLDNPVAGIEEMLQGIGANYTGLFDSKAWKTAKRFTNIQLGTGGVYNISTRESLKRTSKNLAVKGTAMYLGYQVADSFLRTISPEGGLFDQGLATGLTNIYAQTRIGFAKVWSDRFQGYKEKQEQYAPGSTDLTTLLAFPLAGALAGAQAAYFGRVGVGSVKGIDKAAGIFNVEKTSALLSNFGIDSKLKPMKRNALVGGLIGAAFTLPFLPGALVGTSSEELKAQYSGEKDVAEKANKFWMFGGTPWEGGATKSFTKSVVARMRADATDKVRYGDDATKKSMDPFLHPFSYLADPYRFEKRNAESMPYPIWGMDVSYGGIFGKVFERTVGQLIKPDKINPAVVDAIRDNTLVVAPGTKLSPSSDLGSGVADVVHIKQESGSALISGIKGLFNTEEGTKLQGISDKDEALIREGLMQAPDLPTYSPVSESLGLSYKSIMDFTGIKGWSSSLVVDGLGMSPNTRLQYARSGEANSSARDLLDQNMGDLFGLGEGQRKLLPTSSGALPDRFNPIANNAASWLPKDKAKFFLDFSHGNPYSKVARGEERLPGVGYAALNPELEGLDPENYPLVYKYKILSDVARGSREYVQTRIQALNAYQAGDLNKREVEILGETLDQEQQLQQKKDFYEVPNKFGGPLGMFQSSLWEAMRTNAESPLEMLTPIRPAAKFLHKRTAIEDYVETQLGGSDTAIWTNPYSHFIKPAMNKSRQSMPFGNNFFIPKETREKYDIDEYFDKFDYLRKRRNSSDEQAMSTVIGSSLSGLNTKEKVLKFRASLEDNQKDYFNAFSKETDEGKRNAIRAMLPEDVRRAYEQLWDNLDTSNRARANGVSVQKAIADKIHDQTNRLKSLYEVDLSKAEKQAANSKVSSNSDSYANLGMSRSDRIKFTEDEMVRLKMADKEALTYITERTGTPGTNFVGWDPRLKTDDIKIRTLAIGGEDLKRFGFWKQDEERMNRLAAITDKSDAVFTQIDEIKTNIRSNRNLKNSIERTMFDNGFKARKIDLVDSSYSSILVEETKN